MHFSYSMLLYECPQTKLQKQETCLLIAPSSKFNLTSKICLVLFTLHSFQVLVFGIMFRVDHCYLKESQLSQATWPYIKQNSLFYIIIFFIHSPPTLSFPLLHSHPYYFSILLFLKVFSSYLIHIFKYTCDLERHIVLISNHVAICKSSS